MTLFKIIYRVSLLCGHLKGTYKLTKEILEISGLNVTYLVDLVTGPDL